MPWTRFLDRCTGGEQKLQWRVVYIETHRRQAIGVFEAMFGRDPFAKSCPCCGDDYAVSEHRTLEDATAPDRAVTWWYAQPPGRARHVEPGQRIPSGWRSQRGFYAHDPVSLDAFLAGAQETDMPERRIKIVYADEISS